MEITRDKYLKVKVKGSDGGFITSQSVEANLLFELLQVLKSGLTTRAPDVAKRCPECDSEIVVCMMGHYCGEVTPRG